MESIGASSNWAGKTKCKVMKNVKGEVCVKITRRLRHGMGEKTGNKDEVSNDVWIQVWNRVWNQLGLHVIGQVKQNIKL
jgi:hypothetical protein